MDIEALLKEESKLTFDPQPAMEELVVQEAQKPQLTEEQEAIFREEQYLTEDEKSQVEQFVGQIKLEDSASILQYGAGVQKKMSDFSEGTLERVKSKDLGEVGGLLNGVVMEIKDFDDDDEKGIKGFFKKKVNKLEALRLKYDKAESNIDEICKALEAHQVQLLKDSSMMDQLYELNKVYFRQLTMYILAGKKKIAQTRAEELPKLRAKAEQTGAQEDAQAVNDMEALVDRFEKKIHDLELTRMVSLQMAPQIRMVQSSDVIMSEKIQSTLVNTIPLWKNQMIITLGIEHSQRAAEAQRKVTEFTNELLKKNAEKLKMATIETAKESERGIIDMDTLIQTNQALITTMDEVMKIQADGRQKRREAEVKLVELEDELKQKLLSRK